MQLFGLNPSKWCGHCAALQRVRLPRPAWPVSFCACVALHSTGMRLRQRMHGSAE